MREKRLEKSIIHVLRSALLASGTPNSASSTFSRPKAQIHARHCRETLQKQSGRNEQDHRQRHFARSRRVAAGLRWLRREYATGTAGAQTLVRIDARRTQRRGKPNKSCAQVQQTCRTRERIYRSAPDRAGERSLVKGPIRRGALLRAEHTPATQPASANSRLSTNNWRRTRSARTE